MQQKPLSHRTALGSAWLGLHMPQYVFTIRARNDDASDERTAVLNDDAAALAYACQLAQELVQSGARPDPSMLVKVRDDTRPMVLSIPLLAACA
jgi:hypothetical protein